MGPGAIDRASFSDTCSGARCMRRIYLWMKLRCKNALEVTTFLSNEISLTISSNRVAGLEGASQHRYMGRFPISRDLITVYSVSNVVRRIDRSKTLANIGTGPQSMEPEDNRRCPPFGLAPVEACVDPAEAVRMAT